MIRVLIPLKPYVFSEKIMRMRKEERERDRERERNIFLSECLSHSKKYFKMKKLGGKRERAKGKSRP